MNYVSYCTIIVSDGGRPNLHEFSARAAPAETSSRTPAKRTAAGVNQHFNITIQRP